MGHGVEYENENEIVSRDWGFADLQVCRFVR